MRAGITGWSIPPCVVGTLGFHARSAPCWQDRLLLLTTYSPPHTRQRQEWKASDLTAPPRRSSDSVSTFIFPIVYRGCTNFPSNPSPTPHGGHNHRPNSVRPFPPAFVSQPPVTTVFVSSLEEAVFKALSSLLQNRLGTTGGARHEFHDKFQREADERDRDFIKKYGSDLDTTLISVSVFPSFTSIVALIRSPEE